MIGLNLMVMIGKMSDVIEFLKSKRDKYYIGIGDRDYWADKVIIIDELLVELLKMQPISDEELDTLSSEYLIDKKPRPFKFTAWNAFEAGYRACESKILRGISDTTDDRLNEIEIKHLVWDAGFVGEEWAERGESMNKAFKLIRAAEARILGGTK